MSYKPSNYSAGKRVVDRLSRYVYTAIGSIVNRFSPPMPPLFEKVSAPKPPTPFKAVGIRTPANEDDKIVVWTNNDSLPPFSIESIPLQQIEIWSQTTPGGTPATIIQPANETSERAARGFVKPNEKRT